MDWTSRLLKAADVGDAKAVAKALAQGVHPVRCRVPDGHMGPLASAALLGHAECVEAMLPALEAGAADDVGELVDSLRLSTGASHGLDAGRPRSASLIHARLIEFANADPALFCQSSKDSFAAAAASVGDAASMLQWIALGAEHAKPGCGDSAFIRAAQCGQAECLRLLVPMGVDCEPNVYGNNALDMCFAQGHEEASKVLLEAGMRPNTPTADQGWTMLMYAAKFAPSMVEMAIPFCDPDALNARGMSALMIAAYCDQPECAERLLGICDPELVGRGGLTALDFARSEQVKSLIKARISALRALRERDELGCCAKRAGDLPSAGAARSL